MKILLVSSKYYSTDGGGVGLYLHNLCYRLLKNNHEVSLITSSTCNLESKEILDKMNIYYIPLPRIPLFGMIYWSYLSYNLSKKLIINNKFDIINSHLPTSYFFSVFSGGEIPLVLTLHNSFLNNGTRRVNLFSKFVTILRDILAANRSKIVICLNQDLMHRIRKYCWNKNCKFYRVPLGIDFRDFSYAKPEDKHKMFTLLFVGRIVEGKGLDYLLKAFYSLNNERIKLLIVGDGPLKGELEIKYKDNINIKFLGQINNRKSLSEIYYNSDVFVLPSEGEGMPTTLIEAMASGLPIIASKLPGIEEIVNSKFCRLTRTRDELDLANAISELFLDPKLVQSMSKESLKESSKYNFDDIFTILMNIFESIQIIDHP